MSQRDLLRDSESRPVQSRIISYLYRCSLLMVSTLFAWQATAQVGPSFVPDRPSYADATASVDKGHWHLELGVAHLPDQDSNGSLLLRYGLGKGWELRLVSPTLTQALPYTDLAGNKVEPKLAVGGTLFGGKWAKAFKGFEFSAVTMVGLPLAGTSKAFSPDPLFLTTTQISHSFNTYFSSVLALKYALNDGYIYGQSVAYAEELAHLFGMVGSLVWSNVGWAFFTQAGAELYAGTLIPLVGSGLTLRLSQGTQLDFSVDAPLSSDGPTTKYMTGLTIAW